MKKIITVKTNELEIKISTLGAELQSVKSKNGEEFLWEGDPAVWSGKAPILFPICGGLKEDRYTLSGKEYSLSKHGFLKKSEFEVEELSENSVVMLFKSNEETKKVYPFDFEFRAVFEAFENRLDICYKIKNLSSCEMYYSVGAHEAYACPEGIEEYTVKFSEKENLDASVLQGNLLSDEFVRIAENTDLLPLKKEYFEIDALVFKKIKSRGVSLIKNNSTKRIDVSFDDFCYLLLWHAYNSKYMCIEPWTGIPDVCGSTFDLEKKEGITKLSPENEDNIKHSITFTE